MIPRAISLLILLTLSALSSVSAQSSGGKTAPVPKPYEPKALLKSVKALYKSGSYAQIDKDLTAAFASWPEAAADVRLNFYETSAHYQLAVAENTKIFLNNKPDTAAYFTHVLGVFRYGMRCDSLDHLPDARGRVRPRYTRPLTRCVSPLSGNLLSGGKYFYKQRQYATAYTYFDTYLRSLANPLCSPSSAVAGGDTNADSVGIARLAVTSAYGARRYADVLHWLPLALTDTAGQAPLLELQVQSLRQTGDTTACLAALRSAFRRCPLHPFFSAALIAHYDSLHDHAASLRVVDTLLTLRPRNPRYWYLRGRLLQTLVQPDSAVTAYQRAAAFVPTDTASAPVLAAVYAALGSAWTDCAHRFFARANLTIGSKGYAANRRRLLQLYDHAREAFEEARRLAPADPSLWRDGLREAYFKLNRGSDLKALEASH